MTDAIVWDSLELVEVPVKIAGQDYVLTEASAEETRMWRANNLQAIQMRDKGKGKDRESTSTFTPQIADSHVLLVSLCLSKLVDGKKHRVAMDEIRKWPNKLIETLFDRAQEISGLKDEDSEDEDSEKNSMPKTNSGSE